MTQRERRKCFQTAKRKVIDAVEFEKATMRKHGHLIDFHRKRPDLQNQTGRDIGFLLRELRKVSFPG